MIPTDKRAEIIDYLSKVSPRSDVFIGCDSQVHKKRGQITFVTAVVVHINNKNGCKLFTHTEREPFDFDSLESRLYRETEKTIEAYESLANYLETRHVEIHLDVNASKMYKSNSVAAACKGWAEGATGRDVFIKPDAFAASYAADHHVR